MAPRGTSAREASEDGALSRLPEGYTRREPEQTNLYQVVQQNLESFLAEHPGFPTFVEEEFRRYLDCGILAKILAL